MKTGKKLPSKIILIAIGVTVVIAGTLIYMYGFNRLSQADCTKYEKYDSLRGACYFECETDEQCEEIAKKVDAELNAFFADSKSKISKDKPVAPPAKQAEPAETKVNNTRSYSADETGSETNGTIYTVTSTQDLYPKPSADDQKLWELFVRIASKQTIAERLETFEVFNNEDNDSAASVWESETAAGKWHMNVNAAFASDRKDMIHTMVHEFGHIATLNATQVEKTSGSCPLISVPEGCVKQGTVLGSFYTKFWQQYGERAGGQDDEPVAEYSDDAFVSEYASTNMIEDLAETFAFFVLRPAPTGSSQKDQKIKMLYDQSEMVSLRNRIRAGLASEI